MARRARDGLRVKSFQFVARLIVVERFQIQLPDVYIFADVFRVALNAIGGLVCVKSLLGCNFTRQIFMAFKTFGFQNVLIAAVTNVAILDSRKLLVRAREFSRGNQRADLSGCGRGYQKKDKGKKGKEPLCQTLDHRYPVNTTTTM